MYCIFQKQGIAPYITQSLILFPKKCLSKLSIFIKVLSVKFKFLHIVKTIPTYILCHFLSYVLSFFFYLYIKLI